MKLKFLVLVAASAVAGVAAAFGLRLALPSDTGAKAQLAPGSGMENAANHPDAGEEPEAAVNDSSRKRESQGEKGKAKRAQEPSYFKFSRQFVAPIVRDGRPEAMMVLDVVLELSPTAGEELFSNEPLLRDAVLRALLAQSGRGDLRRMLEDQSLLEATRAAILQSVKEVAGEEVRAVLLMDLAYQPF